MKAEAVKRIDPMEKPLGKIAKTLEQPPISAQSPLAEALSQLKLQLLADTKKITQNEKYVNLQPVFGSIAREYSVSKKVGVSDAEFSYCRHYFLFYRNMKCTKRILSARRMLSDS